MTTAELAAPRRLAARRRRVSEGVVRVVLAFCALVSIAWRGSKVRFGCCPAAISTIIVSPIAREIASTKLAKIPEIAAGTTIRVATWSFVEPRA